MRRARSGGEDGYVIVVVLLLLVVALAAGAAALAETLGARDNATFVARSDRALQAADAGIQTEMYRANQLNLGSLNLDSGGSLSTVLSQLLACPVPQVNSSGQVTSLAWTASVSVTGPCPANGSSGTASPGPEQEPVGQHAYYDVRFIPGWTAVGDFTEFTPKIVALGTETGASAGSPAAVERRVEAILSPLVPWRTLEAAHNLTLNVPGSLSAAGVIGAGSTTLNGTAAASGTLAINGTSGVLTASTFTAASISLASGLTEPSAIDGCPVSVASDVTLSLTAGNETSYPAGSAQCANLVNRPAVQLDPSKADCAPVTATVSCATLFDNASWYDPSTDSVYCAAGCPALTLQPGDYVFCDFQYNGAVTLGATSAQAVRVFIDNPSSSRCGGAGSMSHPSSSVSGFQTSYGNFVAPLGVLNAAGAGYPSRAQVYVAGHGTTSPRTVAYVTGNTSVTSEDMFLYAPTSELTVTGGESCVLTTCVNAGTIAGAYVGYDVTASADTISEDLGLLNTPLSNTLGPFHVQQYIECPAMSQSSFDALSDPTSGC